MTSILPFDELNRFELSLRERFADGLDIRQEEDIIDEMLDLLLDAYARGVYITNDSLASDWNPEFDEVMETVGAEVKGETWKERLDNRFRDGGTVEDIIRIADTETHRVANTAALKAAQHGGATQKTWATMLDDRVRDTHDYLEGVTVGIDDDFITYDGDMAQAPGLFSLAENNVNCRCELIFS